MNSRKPIAAMSAKRRAALADRGVTNPMSTLTRSREPKTPRMATAAPVKRQRYTGPSKSVRALVANRSGEVCEFIACAKAAAHTHHRRPRRMGGSKDAATNLACNLLRLCPPHHAWVESDRDMAVAKGLLLPAAADPARVPVETRHGWVLLGADGSFERIGRAAA